MAMQAVSKTLNFEVLYNIIFQINSHTLLTALVFNEILSLLHTKKSLFYLSKDLRYILYI